MTAKPTVKYYKYSIKGVNRKRSLMLEISTYAHSSAYLIFQSPSYVWPDQIRAKVTTASP